jgi:hypothetical protein
MVAGEKNPRGALWCFSGVLGKNCGAEHGVLLV